MNPEDYLIWSSCSVSHAGKVRQYNEDSYIVRDDIGLWAIADGMGGHEAGDIASKAIVDHLAKVKKSDLLSSFVDEVEDQLIAVNDYLIKLAHDQHNDRTIGSTVVVLLAFLQHCIIMWAGDSRAYLCRNGAIEQLSRDHSEVEEMVKKGIISREQAESHPSGNIITRAIGASNELHIDIDATGVQAGDTFLLCSDGLYRHISDQEIYQHLTMDNIEDACNQLLSLTLDRGAKDNVTIIVVRALKAV